MSQYMTFNTVRMRVKIFYNSHILIAQWRMTLLALQGQPGVTLGNRMKKQGHWETGFLVARA